MKSGIRAIADLFVKTSEPEDASITPEVAAEAPIMTEEEAKITKRPFAEIYEARGVPASAYGAEKLLKVLDGLKAMDETTRRHVISAMDEADDAWTINDPVNDAINKISALALEKKDLAKKRNAGANLSKQSVSAQEESGRSNLAAIRQQINDLQALLERETSKGVADKAALETAESQEIFAFQQEQERFDKEITRLEEVGKLFGPASAPTSIKAVK